MLCCWLAGALRAPVPAGPEPGEHCVHRWRCSMHAAGCAARQPTDVWSAAAALAACPSISLRAPSPMRRLSRTASAPARSGTGRARRRRRRTGRPKMPSCWPASARRRRPSSGGDVSRAAAAQMPLVCRGTAPRLAGLAWQHAGSTAPLTHHCASRLLRPHCLQAASGRWMLMKSHTLTRRTRVRLPVGWLQHWAGCIPLGLYEHSRCLANPAGGSLDATHPLVALCCSPLLGRPRLLLAPLHTAPPSPTAACPQTTTSPRRRAAAGAAGAWCWKTRPPCPACWARWWIMAMTTTRATRCRCGVSVLCFLFLRALERGSGEALGSAGQPWGWCPCGPLAAVMWAALLALLTGRLPAPWRPPAAAGTPKRGPAGERAGSPPLEKRFRSATPGSGSPAARAAGGGRGSPPPR